jgi:HSP20 family protein
MSIRDLTTRVRDDFFPRTADPMHSFQREMNRLFHDFFEVAPFGGKDSGVFPEIDVKETDRDIRVSVELPGLEEKDVEVLLSADSLTIKGEKKEEKAESYYRSERRYGSFSRVIPLASDIEPDKAEAKFKKGVLHITIPKTEKARADVKKIPIKS